MTYAQEQLAYYEERRKQTQQESRATINHPEYYSSSGMEAIDFIDAHGRLIAASGIFLSMKGD